ncbi:phage holin family protein [Pseudalkalibacillus caeni]|nr:phage holin family protein [Pseudalkalibacillus caeni]
MNISSIFNIKHLFTVDFGVAASLSGVAGVLFSKLYGGAPLNFALFIILVWVTIMDWIGGTSAAKKDESYGSEYGKEGIARTTVVFMLPALGNMIDIALNSPGVTYFAITGALIYHTVMSMTANFARAGWEKWIPNRMLESVASEIQAKSQRSADRKAKIQGEEKDIS